MPDARTVEVGNAIVLLISQGDPISSGHTTGYLDFSDKRHRPTFPLSSKTVCEHLMSMWDNQSESAPWRAGRITGWIEALTENAPETFVSIPVLEEVTVFEQCIKKR
jgi:hypothetical protein